MDTIKRAEEVESSVSRFSSFLDLYLLDSNFISRFIRDSLSTELLRRWQSFNFEGILGF